MLRPPEKEYRQVGSPGSDRGTGLLTHLHVYSNVGMEVFSMPRKARRKSEMGIYHIIMRGINRQNIFGN